MKYILTSALLYSFLVLGVWSHPLDISLSTASFSGNTMNITTYFHTYEIDYLLQQHLGSQSVYSVDDYFTHADIITDYITSSAQLINNTHQCDIQNIALLQDEAYVILSDGLGVSYRFVCDQDINHIALSFHYFTQFPLQTNRVTLYDVSQGFSKSKAIVYKVLNPKIPTLELSVFDTTHIQHADSDRDGVSDEDEKIYATDPNNPDSDGDFFSDSEEIESGWDPLNPEMGPGQIAREKSDIPLALESKDTLTDIVTDIESHNLGDFGGQGSGFLKKTMKYINDFFEKNEGHVAGVFLFVFILGIIHTLGPGHSKGLLISYTLEKNNGYLKGFLFATLFTITHILDILVLFFVSRGVSHFFQINYTFMIQVASSILLLCLGFYILYRSYITIHRGEETSNNSSLWVAFFAGLAPCSFAWSIFLLLHALGKTQWMFPLIGALGLGIFTTLCCIVILSVFLKQRMYEKIHVIGKYSSIISALMVLGIAVIMIVNII